MKLTPIELSRWKMYRKQGTNYNRCKVNEFNLFTSNSIQHEICKLKIFYDLIKNGSKVITECQEIGSGFRRDLVDLSTGEIFEIEDSTSKRGHRHTTLIDVYYYDLNRFRTREEALKDAELIDKGETE